MDAADYLTIGSHPSRGAWIEISFLRCLKGLVCGRTPHGVRGLKSILGMITRLTRCRTPHGVRGLKSSVREYGLDAVEVAPLTGCVD